MCLLPDRIANNQLSGVTEAAPHPCTCPEEVDGTFQAEVDRGHKLSSYSDEDEDDSRDRQTHWKRIKTHSKENSGASAGERYRYMSRDYHGYERTSGEKRHSHSSGISDQRQAHKMIILKGNVHDKDDGRQRSSYGTHDLEGRSGNKGWDVSVRRGRDGGTACEDIDPRAGKRKYEASSFDGRGSIPNRSPRVMCGRSMVAREKHMARRLPATEGYDFRVPGRELGEVDGEDQTLSLQNSSRTNDHCEKPRISLDLRQFLKNRVDSLSTENRGFADLKSAQQNGGGGFDTKGRGGRADIEVSFGNGKVSSHATPGSVDKKVPAPRLVHDDGKEFDTPMIFGTEREDAMEWERRQEKGRTRWAEKERDLEKENVPKTATKSVTVVDYSDKFTVAKAPISLRGSLSYWVGISIFLLGGLFSALRRGQSIPEKPVEADPHRLCQRQKQIDYGKNTLGYERYMDVVPRYSRTKSHPRTPDIRQVCSKRSWDGQIRKWRRLLHEYDPPKGEDEEDPDQLFVPAREQDSIKGSTTDDSMMDTLSEGDKLVEDTDLKIYDGWSDDDC